MSAQELIDMLDMAHFETKAEWYAFRDKAHAIFDTLSAEDREIVLEENVFEMLSMIIAAYEYVEEKENGHTV